MADEKTNKLLQEINAALKNKPVENNIFIKKVLIEKCYKGRMMSPKFLKRTETFYKNINSTLDRQESFVECALVELLSNFEIYAILKSDKRSLPYTNEIVVKLPVESNMNAMWNYKATYRKIVLELLEKNVHKIRFYVHMETYENDSWFLDCGIKYCFRYYMH